MADETTTPPDSTNSETIETVTDAPSAEQPEAAVETSDEAKPGDTGEEGSVLGGDVAEDKAEGDDAPQRPPEAYELAMEGVELDREAVEAAEPVFRELGLSNDQANKLMPVAKDFADRTANATLKQIVDAGAQQKADWLAAFKADEKIGGAKAEETTHLAAKALDALGYPAGSDFRKVLTETGFGNHPEMIRVFRTLGEMVGEDGFIRSDETPKTDIPTEKRWYGKKEG